MLMGIVLHGAIPFYRHEPDPITHGALDFSVWVVHTFRMPAFFMLSGFFGALLWARRGAVAMLMNRFERIVLPLGFIMIVLVPGLIFVFALVEGLFAGTEGALGQAAGKALAEAPLRDFEHLWFLYHLAWISFIAA